ncbi:hypothetical protein NA256_19360 [Salmonella sp. NW805]|uniref:hypothetical protein n=1 Tax=Salmonella TaxID=590 RepID=UPI0012FE08F5|nr:hypothetical protein [Salmonella enterica]EDS3723086.1 hypothetical protein [Salmonella enterica subsp. enterica]EDT8784669.1 hypothetical protein [Salmonella enterica subsp. diarizonae]EEV5085270.1 hypothetical protein [Salmonella enterica subsp. enterica serovar Kentucky]EGU4333014.1 hypothetical protein [Salmonella enterica]EJB6341501.1 hypothetical protein [Salmonella enterica]
MFFIILTVLVSGGLLFADRYKYFLSSPVQAICWFVFVVQGIVLVASLIEGKPLIFAGL